MKIRINLINAAGDEGATAAASDSAPLLMMAARCGDSNELKRLIVQPLDDQVAVVVDHDDGPPPAAALLLYATGGDSLLHVVAAASGGDGEGFVECAKIICGVKGGRRLLLARNKNGDTPLHCAAAAGNAAMIDCLLDLAGDDHHRAALVRVQNQCGETALHHAVKRACIMKRCRSHRRRSTSGVDCIDKLMAVDPELACIPVQDDADASSPLYVAISLGEMEIARHLFEKSQGKLSYSGPHGRNVLHAAVSCANNVQALCMILEWLKKGGADDLKRLTSQGDKKNGSTPLHLAASLGGFPSTLLIPCWSWMFPRQCRMVIQKLLGANKSTAYQADDDGLYPIHVAAGAGNILAVEMLLEACKECASLRDANGRTFLHVAVDKGELRVVEYVCRPIRSKMLSWMLNAQDDNGDTPLHRAVHAGNGAIFGRLFRKPQVRLDVANKEGMRPIDVAWSRMPLEVYYAWDPRIHIRSSLLKAAAPYGESTRGDLFKENHKHLFRRGDAASVKHDDANDDTQTQQQQQQQQHLFEGGEDAISATLTSAAQVMGILSVLVTTVAFASAFTLPGGYRADGDAAGTPVLAGTYAFEAFILADAMAFICSLVATSLLLYAGVPAFRLSSRFASVNQAYALMMHSARSLVAAFGLGLYVALHPVARTIAIVVTVLMVMLVRIFTKESEGIDYIVCRPVVARRRKPSAEWILRLTIYVLERSSSYILIFGIPAIHIFVIPAIRKWARARR
ncbi:hypothetical protein HU200_056534 [Digitaria exilis]|uniref:PGG domain-containing protein n=1 Tax=Digitaria exilis TaxID=1010633 RepID=A0A835AMJ7_9POAL|nr:hypothetical protein HU200_056534 [Digitaria exilis]